MPASADRGAEGEDVWLLALFAHLIEEREGSAKVRLDPATSSVSERVQMQDAEADVAQGGPEVEGSRERALIAPSVVARAAISRYANAVLLHVLRPPLREQPSHILAAARFRKRVRVYVLP